MIRPIVLSIGGLRRHSLLLILAAIVMALSTPGALQASGSSGYGANTPYNPRDSTGFGAESGDADERIYNRGKQLYEKKLACADCPLAAERLGPDLATQIMADDSMTASLSPKERKMVHGYLKRRFRL